MNEGFEEEMVLLQSDESDSDLEDALLLEISNDRKIYQNRAEIYGTFNLINMTESECKR